jgi:hypothetical protein
MKWQNLYQSMPGMLLLYYCEIERVTQSAAEYAALLAIHDSDVIAEAWQGEIQYLEHLTSGGMISRASQIIADGLKGTEE